MSRCIHFNPHASALELNAWQIRVFRPWSASRMNPQLQATNSRPLFPMSADRWCLACGDSSVRIETNRYFKGHGGPAER
jgi:hypothetical protein